MERTCSHCGEPFEAKRRDALYCSARHRAAAHARREAGLPPLSSLPVVEVAEGNVEEALRAYLEDTGRMDDPLAPAALSLARRLDRDRDSLSGMAMATKALETVVSGLRPSDDRAGVDTVDFLRFVRALHQVDPVAAATVRAVVTPAMRQRMAENASRYQGLRLRVGGAR